MRRSMRECGAKRDMRRTLRVRRLRRRDCLGVAFNRVEDFPLAFLIAMFEFEGRLQLIVVLPAMNPNDRLPLPFRLEFDHR